MSRAGTQGLGRSEAEARLRTHGPNTLPAEAPTPLWLRFLQQFRSPLVYVLLLALAFDAAAFLWEGAHGLPFEALVIGGVLLLNAGLGTFQEHRSEAALARLEALAAPQAWVWRDGSLDRIPTADIVPGDLLRVEAGERVPADGVLTDARGVSVDESLLTGESMPVDKVAGDAVCSGTLVVRGQGTVEVQRTGRQSSMGQMAAMLTTVRLEATPLERRLHALGHQIARWVGTLALALAFTGVLAEGMGRVQEMVLFAVALAVAAVPEGMPAVVTLTLALGVQRMVRRNAVVRRLAAVEALGSVTVIATDKTGTLTENQMRVHAVEAVDPGDALVAMVLANEADDRHGVGDPLEIGLLTHAREAGIDIPALRAARPRCDARPFDSAWKFMRATVAHDEARQSWFKGAPEVLLARAALAPSDRRHWHERAESAAHDGYRVLALARADGHAEHDLTFLGLVFLWDPPRPEVPHAIREARSAGVRVVLITGDHPGTASAVASAIGLARSGRVMTGQDLDTLDDDGRRAAVRDVDVFARVSPRHKLELVEALKADGQVVAMTGDGVNDAAALKRADVGVAMGQRGSEVAREVSDLVLLDDNFASIVGAIEEGRNIYENIQKFIRFLFSTNLALVVLVLLGAGSAWVQDLRDPTGALLLPLTALQLLWINFIGDGPPALALSLDQNHGVMRRPPRPADSPLLDGPSLRFVVSTGLLKAGSGGLLLLALPRLGYGLVAVRTAVFVYEALAQLAFVYPSRHLAERPARNVVLHAVVAASVALQLTTLVVAPLRALLGLDPLDATALGAVLGGVVLTWLLAEGLSRCFLPHR